MLLLEPEPPLLQSAKVFDENVMTDKTLQFIAVHRMEGSNTVLLPDPDSVDFGRLLQFVDRSRNRFIHSFVCLLSDTSKVSLSYIDAENRKKFHPF